MLATAGVAIGLGNIWRFPYMMGKYGGSAFLLVYVGFLVVFGVPALMAEWALGRHTQRGPWQAYQRAGVPGATLWAGVLLLTITMACSYYGVVIGWVLYFAVEFGVAGAGGHIEGDFTALTSSFGAQAPFVWASFLLVGGALFLGVRNGIERASKVALPIFFALFAVLAVRALTLEGAREGLAEFLVPRWDHFTGAALMAAMGQAAFSLGLGGTLMVVYGSYLRREEDIPSGAVWTAGADLGAALLAGLIVVPCAVALDVPLNSGPPLMFEVMPEVFSRMPAGLLFGAAFFGSIFLVAELSLMAGLEVIVAAIQDALGWSRVRAVVAIVLVELFLAVPAMYSVRYVELSDMVWGSTMHSIGAVVAVVALGWCVGRSKALEEIRRNARLPVPGWLFGWMRVGIPLGIMATLVYGWVSRGSGT